MKKRQENILKKLKKIKEEAEESKNGSDLIFTKKNVIISQM